MNSKKATVLCAVGFALLVVWFAHKKRQEAQWRDTCIQNLRWIVVSKQIVAEEDKLAPGDRITEIKVAGHLIGRGKPGTGLAGLGFACPAGGDYTVNPIASNPVCSIHGRLPDR